MAEIKKIVDLSACENGKDHIWKNKTIGYVSDTCLVCGRTKASIQWLKKIQKQTDTFFSQVRVDESKEKDTQFNMIKIIEKTIKIPVEKWRGQCFGIADLMLKHKLIEGKLRYGHWTGPVAKGSRFEKYPDGLSHHGWIELPDGMIVDPTRFDFEQKPPYIYVGKNDYYDAGGNKLLLATMQPPPKFDVNEKQIFLTVKDKSAIRLIENLLDREVNKDSLVIITIKQALWLANLPIQILDKADKPIYEALIQANLGAFIPYDNRKLVLER